LFAEDVMRGYAVHVFDSLNKRWHSLTRRKGKYSFPTITTDIDVEDEAAITESMTSDPTKADGSSPDMRTPPSLFHWTGWSLAAQHPGTHVQKDGTSGAPANTPLATGFQFEADFQAAPQTLPRLRFGKSYKFRGRAVDVAGNRLPFGDPTLPDPHETVLINYARFEPVPQPVLLLRRKRTEGESV